MQVIDIDNLIDWMDKILRKEMEDKKRLITDYSVPNPYYRIRSIMDGLIKEEYKLVESAEGYKEEVLFLQ